MASPLPTGKQPVNLASDGPRVSRIRRDPPPAARKTLVPDREIVDKRAVAIGIGAFALAILVLILVLGDWAGWSPRDHTVRLRMY
jgi:hypothetical protein